MTIARGNVPLRDGSSICPTFAEGEEPKGKAHRQPETGQDQGGPMRMVPGYWGAASAAGRRRPMGIVREHAIAPTDGERWPRGFVQVSAGPFCALPTPLVEKMEVLRNYEVPGTFPLLFPTVCLLD
ncbi:uncharacterized protein BO87DRAFT_452644 [Aspergillus neoniger CBS 115656]|uniref:Uncharacterized protein n=1 Tax=Aspergillus neoniger (strain CBS 115656) TaxID=1448310 RepID=A0A318Z8V1_ASPNB|nr:hypothetical protein BO87DRAFT_452644 [Aspergillus neoniger CBS 115656]PYH36688.1 hypothetical protein BO87DRAFT_452644 [Aspergillus neoniger CBS 115656]